MNRGLQLDLTKLATPRGGAETFRLKSARKLEGLRSENGFTADVQNDVSKIIQNALVCGSTHASIQTLRIDRQYSYSFQPSEDSFVIHDLYSLVPIENVTARITLASAARDLVNWVREHELDVIVCSRRMDDNPVVSRVPIADWVQLVVLFIPFKPVANKHTIGSIFNAQFTDKQLDIAAWNERLLRAQACGSALFINSILYVGADFGIGIGKTERTVVQPFQHPTRIAMKPDPGWAVSERLIGMVAWVSQLGYRWTLSAPSAESKWAYFIVCLDPLNTYK